MKKLFKQGAESNALRPAVHQLIKRSEEEEQFKVKFIGSLVHRRLNDWLKNQYGLFNSAPNDIDEAIDFLINPSMNGFVIHLHKTGYSIAEIIAFFDYLKGQVLTLDYHSYVSELKQYNKGIWSEELQRHYLKPSLRVNEIEQKKINQRYGNINIELIIRNAKPWHLKFSATTYNDRLYKSSDNFEDLLILLCRV